MLFTNSNKCFSLQPDFSFDEACLDLVNTYNTSVSVWGQYTECHNCPFQELATISPFQNTSVLANTRWPLQIFFSKEDNKKQCSNIVILLLEHYRYGWNLTDKCTTIYIKEQTSSAYLPILTAFITLFFFGTFWYMIKCIYRNSSRLRNIWTRQTDLEHDLIGSSNVSAPLVIESPPTPLRKHPYRIKSLDVFRGFCIILMIFVNYGGGKYWFFEHSQWNGLTVADLVFPWFMWLMGTSLSVSLQSKLRKAVPRRQLVVNIIRRSSILLLLGIIINSNKNLQTIGSLRFPGVLQRLGITYFIVAMLEVVFVKRIEIDNTSRLSDIIIAWPQWICIITLLIIHSCVIFLVNVPNNCGHGYLGPGGLDNNGNFFNCTGGLTGYIDREVFGQHIYKCAEFTKLYETKLNFDPEGILSTLPSIATVYFGVQAGRILHTFQDVRSKVIRWTIWGTILVLLGGSLAEFKQNDGLIPLNKQLWSLSYTFLLSGLAFLILAFLFILVDITRKWGGRPFFYPGMNSIFLFVGHELFRNTFPFAWTPTSDTHGAYLFMNLWGTAIWVAISIFLYKRNVFFIL